MALDVRGGLKNTQRSKSRFVTFDELLSNAIDSYLIRRKREESPPSFDVSFVVEFFDRTLEGQKHDLKVTCADNGAGLGDAERKAFVTKDTTYKDDLSIDGIGRCKGTGRIQFFHFFKRLDIVSRYAVDGTPHECRLSVDETVREISESNFSVGSTDNAAIGTTVTLDGVKDDVLAKVFGEANLQTEFSAQAIRRHLMTVFMHRLVTIKGYLGDFVIKIQTRYKGKDQGEQFIKRADLPEVAATRTVNVPNGNTSAGGLQHDEQFVLSHYKLDSKNFDLPRNVIALCAKSSPVESITRRYLKTGTLENNPLHSMYHIVLVEADYLDSNVNEQRDSFRIPKKRDDDGALWDFPLSMEEIFDVIDPEIRNLIEPPNWDRSEIVATATQRFGISESMIADTNIRVHFGDTAETVARRVLTAYQDRMIEETSEIDALRQTIANAAPDSPDFRQMVNELAWKYTASLKSIDMANLSQLVVRRAAIIEILALAVRKQLEIQADPNARSKDEKLIHSIFFPMGKDSSEADDHDIWLLNEEYQYFDYIASDKSLSAIKWDGAEALFDGDIDEKLTEIFQRNAKENAKKRPDIAIFSKAGAAIIIEFKAPDVSMDDHVADLMEYSQLLAAKSKGRIKQFYGYLIGSTLNQNRLRGYNRFPNGRGWFSTEPIVEHGTQTPLGELYSEILFYEDIVDRASMRLQVYRDRLNLDLGNRN